MKNATDISVVLDRSGSMQAIANDVIGGFNTFLKEQQETSGEATLTLAQFDDMYEVVHDNKPLNTVPPLTSKTFVPRNGTALLDAIGRTVNATGKRLSDLPEAQRPDKVVFVIITDGQENASREFTATQVKDLLNQQRETYNWQFVFLGANQDAIITGMCMGVTRGANLTYAANARGTQSAFGSTTKNLKDYRMGAKANLDFTDKDREEQKLAGA